MHDQDLARQSRNQNKRRNAFGRSLS
jgi:hypothetical protein